MQIAWRRRAIGFASLTPLSHSAQLPTPLIVRSVDVMSGNKNEEIKSNLF